MKKAICFWLSLMLCLPLLAACDGGKLELPTGLLDGSQAEETTMASAAGVRSFRSITKLTLVADGRSADVKSDFEEVLLQFLDGGVWVEEMPDCEADYIFTTDLGEIGYHSESGTLMDRNGRCSLTFGDFQRQKVAAFLSEYFQADGGAE